MNLEGMRQVVLRHKPNLQRIVDECGNHSVLSYMRDRALFQPQVSKEKQVEMLSVVFDEVKRLFGEAVAREAVDQLVKDYYVSTAEHHAPLSHPFVVSGTVMQSFINRERGLPCVLVFSCGTISLNNSSSPRSIVYHDAMLQEQKIHLLPHKFRREPVCVLPPFSNLPNTVRSAPEAVQQVIEDGAVKTATSFGDQISRINYRVGESFPGELSTKLLYIQQEKIVADLLVRFHLIRSTVLHAILFTTEGWQSYEKHFADVVGAHSSSAAYKGTFLFWGIHKGLRIPLFYKNGSLYSVDNTLRFALTPEAVGEALQKGMVVPNMALCYSVLSFYYGLTLGGGFSQVDYLPLIRSAFERVVRGVGETFIFPTVATNVLSADFAFIALQNQQQSVLATGFDVLLYTMPEHVSRLRQRAESCTLREALDNLMPEFYTIVQGSGQQSSVSLKSPPASLRV